MSQRLVFQLLKEVGRATTKQIALLATERHPGSSLHFYVGNRLNKLRKWGYVDKDKNGFWYIAEELEKAR